MLKTPQSSQEYSFTSLYFCYSQIQSLQLVRHCACALRHETLIKFIIIIIIIIIIIHCLILKNTKQWSESEATAEQINWHLMMSSTFFRSFTCLQGKSRFQMAKIQDFFGRHFLKFRIVYQTYPRTKICLKKFYVTHIHFKYMSSPFSYLKKNDYLGELLKLIVKPVSH